MRNANFKKLVALATVATMLVAPATVFAEESADGATNAGSVINGTGEVEDYISKDVFKVILPTVTDVNFTLDPQGLLKVADSTTYSIGEGAVYFANVGESGTTYSSTSDAIVIANKSSYDVDVAFSVDVTLPEGITLAASKDALANATTPTVYLGMAVGSNEATALVSGTNTAAVQQVAGVAEGADGYSIVADGSADTGYTYSYALSSTFDDSTAAKASYTLTGACDTTADWTTVKDLDVTAKITWSCTKHADTPAAPEVVDPEEAYSEWDATDGNIFWAAIDAEGGIDDTAKLTSVQIQNSSTGEFADVDYTVDSGWIKVLWDDMTAAGLDSDATDLTIQFTYDGTLYSTSSEW